MSNAKESPAPPASHHRRLPTPGSAAAALGLAVASLNLLPPAAHAVVSLGPDGGDPNHNTTAPTGLLSGSGWDLAGDFHGFLAYPIDPTHFIAAKHIGGGATFTFDSVTYNVANSVFFPGNNDLAIHEISGGTFPRWAPLYTGNNEIGKDFVVFGNGAARGAGVNVVNQPVSVAPLRGWLWGSSDFRTRWGQNNVTDAGTDAALGDILVAEFNRESPLTDEATLSSGDSSGGWFILDTDNVWKLAALSYAVEADFAFIESPGSVFQAAIFDAGGLFEPSFGNVTDAALDLPTVLIGSRISANLPWIAATVPETNPLAAAATAILTSFGMIAVRRRLAARATTQASPSPTP